MAPDPAVAVHCRGLAKHYGEGHAAVSALRGVDLDVRFGELLLLVGPSGCGKTTLVSILTAILEQGGGECVVLGQDLQQLDERARARLRNTGIGIVFQSFNLLPALSALDNVAVPLLLADVPRADAEARARRVLDRVGLSDRIDDLPGRMSGGERQRVAIARALVHDPRLVVCDEPTSNLDAENGHAVMQMLRDIASAPDRALLVVTHDIRIFDVADRIARMEDGRVVEVIDNARDGNARKDSTR